MRKNVFLVFVIFLNLGKANCQLSLKKENRYVVLYENNIAVDSLLGSPGKLYDYKIINKNHVLFILEVRGLIVYENMKFDAQRWRSEKSSNTIANHQIIGSVARNNEDRKVYQYKITVSVRATTSLKQYIQGLMCVIVIFWYL
jgi:hypothetical protein